jgi:hypothetical protein
LWLLRIAATAHLVLALVQPVLAGLFLTGSVDAIKVHGVLGSVLAVAGQALIVSAIAYVVARGRLWVIPAMVALFLAVGLQIGMGYARVLQLHVPLGVAIVTISALLAIWVWTPSAARPRGRGGNR